MTHMEIGLASQGNFVFGKIQKSKNKVKDIERQHKDGKIYMRSRGTTWLQNN